MILRQPAVRMQLSGGDRQPRPPPDHVKRGEHRWLPGLRFGGRLSEIIPAIIVHELTRDVAGVDAGAALVARTNTQHAWSGEHVDAHGDSRVTSVSRSSFETRDSPR